MAVLGSNNLTLLDWAQRRDPDGGAAKIANLLTQQNDILLDAVYRQANSATGHTVTIATGLPDIYFRQFNAGVPDSKATTTQVTEGMAIMEARSTVDKDLAELEDDVAAFRASEATMFLEAMNQKMASTLFYGNALTDPASFSGLAVRYSSLSAGNAQNIIDAGGTTALGLASVYLVCWSDETVFCIFPKGSMAGLSQRDLGEDTVRRTVSGVETSFQALIEWFQWKSGLCLKDWRYAGRICNIEVGDFLGLTGTQSPTVFTNLLHKMTILANRIPSYNVGKCAWYVNRSIFGGLQRLAMEKFNAALSFEPGVTQFGTPGNYTSFMGIPIRRADALLNTEARVV